MPEEETVAALIGLFGLSEILIQVSKKKSDAKSVVITDEKVSTPEILKHWFLGIYSSVLGVFRRSTRTWVGSWRLDGR